MHQNDYLAILGALTLGYIIYKGFKLLLHKIPKVTNPFRKWVQTEVVKYLNEIKNG